MKLDEDQRGLRDAVRELTTKHTARVRDAITEPGGYDPAAWSEIAQIGLAGIAVDERHGGAGASRVELAIALEELGRGLVPSPLFQTAALAVPLLQEAGDGEVADRWLPRIAAGEVQATVAYRADLTAAGDALTGTAHGVVGATTADLLLVAADDAGTPTLFAVQAPADGLVVEDQQPLDPTRPLAAVHFDGVAAQRMCPASDPLGRALVASRALLAAEQVGGAGRCLEMAVEYAKTRVQFGKPIGGFQAIKHICADIYTDVECARALTYDAIRTGGVKETGMTAALASEAFVAAAERNMQVHGGISYTWEHDCHLFLKRARSSERLLGTVRDAYATVATALDL